MVVERRNTNESRRNENVKVDKMRGVYGWNRIRNEYIYVYIYILKGYSQEKHEGMD